jgi:hypothetical protein
MKEIKLANELLNKWKINYKKRENIFLSLYLLNSFFKNIQTIRDFGVELLKFATDKDILLILNQLIISLRYEKDVNNSKLINFLLTKTKNKKISNNIFW